MRDCGNVSASSWESHPHSLVGVRGFEVPSWRALAAGLRPRDPEDFQTEWQHEASSRIEQEHRETLFRVMEEPQRALLRSQGGSGTGAALQTCPTCPLTRIDPLCSVFCCCDVCGVAVHSILVVTTEQLAQEQGSWEDEGSRWTSAAARICRGGGARRDMDLAAPNPGDARRLEIVAGGLPLFGGAQLAIDTTLISTLHCDGSAPPTASVAAGGGKSAPIRSWLAPKAGPDQWHWRVKWSVVPRDKGFLEPACQGEGPARASHSASEGVVGLEIVVASDLVMCSRESIREVVAGIARCGGL